MSKKSKKKPVRIEDFGELRSLVNAVGEVPRKRAWRKLFLFFRAALDDAPNAVSEEWLPYTLQALERWPDRLRYLPHEDLARVIAGEHLGAVMTLVKALRIGSEEVSWDTDLFSIRDFSWVRHVSFGEGVMRPDSYRRLVESEVFSNLVSLEIVSPSTSSWVRLATMLRAPFAKNLKYLGLVDCALDGKKLKSLARWSGVRRLEGLDLSRNPTLRRDWATLAEARLDALKTLDVSYSWYEAEELEPLFQAPWLAQLEDFGASRSFGCLIEEGPIGHLNMESFLEFVRACDQGEGGVKNLYPSNRSTEWDWMLRRQGALFTSQDASDLYKRLKRMIRLKNRDEGVLEMLRESALPEGLVEGAIELTD